MKQGMKKLSSLWETSLNSEWKITWTYDKDKINEGEKFTEVAITRKRFQDITGTEKRGKFKDWLVMKYKVLSKTPFITLWISSSIKIG